MAAIREAASYGLILAALPGAAAESGYGVNQWLDATLRGSQLRVSRSERRDDQVPERHRAFI